MQVAPLHLHNMTVDARDMSHHPSSTALDKNPILFAIAVMLASIALLTFSLRAYTRAKVLRSFHIDDWIALVVAVGPRKYNATQASLTLSSYSLS